MSITRRQFLNQMSLATAGLGISTLLPQSLPGMGTDKRFSFTISLAEFSFASELFTGKMSNMDFPARAKEKFGIHVLEYVSAFFNEKHTDSAYLKELKLRCDDLGMINHLIMVDGQNIAAINADERQKAVESHYAWVDAAKVLGCSAIRVNLGDMSAMFTGKRTTVKPEAEASAAVEGYGMLLDYAAKVGINVIAENHIGNSTNPDWLVGVIKQVKQKNKGFLVDFSNFCEERTAPKSMEIKDLMATTCVKEYDKYDGVTKMMPYAKGISAKTHKFDKDGNELETDFRKMFKIIKKSGWTGGYIGIEYEGGLLRDFGGDQNYLTNDEGVLATKALLEKMREEFTK